MECSEGYQERLLPTAIQAYMDEVGEGYHEDTMRAFFRLQVRIEITSNMLERL
jgi:hypothetical protein